MSPPGAAAAPPHERRSSTAYDLARLVVLLLYFRLDLGNFASIREFAAQQKDHLKRSKKQLDVLVNNAGGWAAMNPGLRLGVCF
jgi:NAD(P)-dependent dehydrogenase (short-subunit alcohol dehydrogenase family)